MNRLYYLVAIAIGIGVWIYYYLFNFDNMSETMLIDSVLHWYLPLIFGLFGLMALRLSKTIDPPEINPIKFLFSWKDRWLSILMILIFILTGVMGIAFFLIPLAVFKVKSKNYDVFVALLGSILWLLLLFLFFKVIWPSL